MKDQNDELKRIQEERENTQVSPEDYLEKMAQEKDLVAIMHFCQLVNAKYMQVSSQKYLEELSKSGPGGVPQMVPGMAAGVNGF